MRQRLVLLHAVLLLGGCATLRPTLPTPPPAAAPLVWEQRLPALQHLSNWSLDGRAAASAGKQGWQASVNWRQLGDSSELHFSGPLGLGASFLRLTPDGLSVDGAPPRTDIAETLHQRLGVDVPLASLRYWVLGVPDPGAEYTLTSNGQDRVHQLVQSGWTIDIDRYLPVDGDSLPAQLVLHRDDVRLRIAVDHWMLAQ